MFQPSSLGSIGGDSSNGSKLIFELSAFRGVFVIVLVVNFLQTFITFFFTDYNTDCYCTLTNTTDETNSQTSSYVEAYCWQWHAKMTQTPMIAWHPFSLFLDQLVKFAVIFVPHQVWQATVKEKLAHYFSIFDLRKQQIVKNKKYVKSLSYHSQHEDKKSVKSHETPSKGNLPPTSSHGAKLHVDKKLSPPSNSEAMVEVQLGGKSYKPFQPWHKNEEVKKQVETAVKDPESRKYLQKQRAKSWMVATYCMKHLITVGGAAAWNWHLFRTIDVYAPEFECVHDAFTCNCLSNTANLAILLIGLDIGVLLAFSVFAVGLVIYVLGETASAENPDFYFSALLWQSFQDLILYNKVLKRLEPGENDESNHKDSSKKENDSCNIM